VTDPDTIAAIRARADAFSATEDKPWPDDRLELCELLAYAVGDRHTLLAALDEANAELDGLRDDIDDLHSEAITKGQRIAELEAHLESLQNRYAQVTAENDELRAALARAPTYDRIQADRDVYDDWKDKTRELLK